MDFEAGTGRLSVTASRMRPFADVPRIQINNNQQYTNGSKRLSTNYVMTRNSWVSESRFGWNRNTLDRFDAFWLAESPTRGAQEDLYNVRKRISTFSVVGLLQQRRYRNPCLDLRRVQPGPEGHPGSWAPTR